MKVTPRRLNTYLLFKLPAAFMCGVRTRYIDNSKCIVTVRQKWINQNPFESIFWAVQGMAAELTTGAMMLDQIKASGKNISMLVANSNATFVKKATGKITFICNEGYLVSQAVEAAINTGEGQTIWMKSVGRNSEGAEVSRFNFEWTIKVKN